MRKLKKYLTAGILTAIPLWVTWLVVRFLLGIAIDVTGPFVARIVTLMPNSAPYFKSVLTSITTQYVFSILLLLFALCCLGWLTTRLVGRRLVKAVDKLVQRLPLVGKVYWGTKQVVEAFQVKPGKSQQVVLIEYPHPGMKTVGLVTKSLKDTATGASLLAVYVPTTPNPTSGFLEIVPADKVVPVSLSVNDAIAFIVSGGSVGPSEIAFTRELDGVSPNPVVDEQ
jgi:uncharacterized membrane protein